MRRAARRCGPRRRARPRSGRRRRGRRPGSCCRSASRSRRRGPGRAGRPGRRRAGPDAARRCGRDHRPAHAWHRSPPPPRQGAVGGGVLRPGRAGDGVELAPERLQRRVLGIAARRLGGPWRSSAMRASTPRSSASRATGSCIIGRHASPRSRGVAGGRLERCSRACESGAVKANCTSWAMSPETATLIRAQTRAPMEDPAPVALRRKAASPIAAWTLPMPCEARCA